MRILGVDPGSVSGALALLTDNEIILADTPVIDKNVNCALMARMLREWRVDVAAVELVGAFPNQGISSAFNFGRGFGSALGVIGALEVPVVFYTPTRWKSFYNLQGKRDNKDAGRTLAVQLFPHVRGLERVKDGNKADALLIANFHKSRA